MSIAAIIIGRNEGARLLECLASVPDNVRPVIYVDSGSTDDSVAAAKSVGAEVVELDTQIPFTAARARNAGLDWLRQHKQPPEFIQFIDGDCALRAGWIDAAQSFLKTHEDVAVVCGRRRERFPEASVYNALTDTEWNTPTGATRACGGDAMMRWAAVDGVGGYNPALIAGEEPELCVRLRKAGWRIWRLDAEMTWHDIAMTRFSQWWHRSKRAGHAFAEGMSLHGRPPERHNVPQTRRAVLWGGALPLVIVLGCLVTPWAGVLSLLYGLKFLRLRMRGFTTQRAFLTTLGNIPEAAGIAGYWIARLSGKKKELIEYK